MASWRLQWWLLVTADKLFQRDWQRVRNAQCKYITGGTPFDVSLQYGLNISCTRVCSDSYATRSWLLGQLLATMLGQSSVAAHWRPLIPDRSVLVRLWGHKQLAYCSVDCIYSGRSLARIAGIVLFMYKRFVYYPERWLCFCKYSLRFCSSSNFADTNTDCTPSHIISVILHAVVDLV